MSTPYTFLICFLFTSFIFSHSLPLHQLNLTNLYLKKLSIQPFLSNYPVHYFGGFSLCFLSTKEFKKAHLFFLCVYTCMRLAPVVSTFKGVVNQYCSIFFFISSYTQEDYLNQAGTKGTIGPLVLAGTSKACLFVGSQQAYTILASAT